MKTINNSWFKPKFKYFDNKVKEVPAKKKLYIGFELEYELYSDTDRVNTLWDYRIPEKWLYFKEDSSLGLHGLEIVAHPSTYDWILNNRYSIVQLCSVLKENGAEAKSYCGLHVHLSRSAFTKKHLLTFSKLVYEYPEFTKAISRRGIRSLDMWASLTINETDLISKTKKKMTKDSRDSAINTRHKNSIEIRIFKSSLNPNEIFTSIEYCVAAFYYTKTIKNTPSIRGLISRVYKNKTKFPHLYEFILESTYEK